MSKKLNSFWAGWLLLFVVFVLVGCNDETDAPHVI
jgi:hypothetical protein